MQWSRWFECCYCYLSIVLSLPLGFDLHYTEIELAIVLGSSCFLYLSSFFLAITYPNLELLLLIHYFVGNIPCCYRRWRLSGNIEYSRLR